MQVIDRDIAVKMIKNSGSQIFTVTFIKRTDGSERTMNCRLGVSKGLKGVGRNYSPTENGLIPVFDMQKKEYRMISTESIVSLKIAGNKFSVN